MSGLRPVSRGDQFHISDALQPEPLPTKARTLRVAPGNRQPAPVLGKGPGGARSCLRLTSDLPARFCREPDGNPDPSPQ